MSIEYPCVYWSGGMCKKLSDDKVTSWCVEGPCGYQIPSNADKIRAMSDEEITEFVCRNGINTLCDIICGGECNAIASFKKSGDEACKEIVMKWLKQPSEVDHAKE